MKKSIKYIGLFIYVFLLLYISSSIRYNQSWEHTTKCAIILITLAILLGAYSIIDFCKQSKIVEADRKMAEMLYEKSKLDYEKLKL